jgi:aryl-alcohol dehydrogenase-like predicted oxidoreductase
MDDSWKDGLEPDVGPRSPEEQAAIDRSPAAGLKVISQHRHRGLVARVAGGTRFEYQNAPAEISGKVARITDIAQRHNVPIKAAALQFSLAHPATAAVIPGASKPERIAEDYAALNTTIPDDFWHEMRDHHLVAANAPLPIDR